MVRNALLSLLCSAFVIPALSWSQGGGGNIVDVRIVSDSGKEYSMFRAFPRVCQGGQFFYVEAVKGDRYCIQVTNKSDRRVGAVIAVDGRNIISGKKSELRRNERMYIIGPHETNTFEGWRTGMDRTNRFYFTEPSDSYAERLFGDVSAMGTIALAIYREKVLEITPYCDRPSVRREAPSGPSSPRSKESASADRLESKRSEEAGTGFGETTYSPARLVEFEPEQMPAQKVVLKYEWRSELCRKGILSCGPKNRFWPDEQEFAPIPKDFGG